jgi:hypothetical protein
MMKKEWLKVVEETPLVKHQVLTWQSTLSSDQRLPLKALLPIKIMAYSQSQSAVTWLSCLFNKISGLAPCLQDRFAIWLCDNVFKFLLNPFSPISFVPALLALLPHRCFSSRPHSCSFDFHHQ